ncbi:MAG: hypothetical protein CMP76_17415 [Flavobacterium sp.]|nr:hypothetical protein [Flavobacterium sp.]
MTRNILCIFSIVFLFFSCKKNKNEKNKSDFVEIFVIKKEINYPIAINCNSIHDEAFKEMRTNKIISNTDFILKFKELSSNLKKTDDNSQIDTRVQIITHFENSLDTICISKTRRISINSKNKMNSEKFVEFIFKEVY